jgi:hypothetical protein
MSWRLRLSVQTILRLTTVGRDLVRVLPKRALQGGRLRAAAERVIVIRTHDECG